VKKACFLPIVSFPACSRPKLGQRSCNTDILVDFYMLQDWTYFVRKLQAAACSLTKSLGYFHYLKVNRKKDRCCFKIQFSIRKKKTSSICLIFIFSKILVIFFLNLIAWETFQWTKNPRLTFCFTWVLSQSSCDHTIYPYYLYLSTGLVLRNPHLKKAIVLKLQWDSFPLPSTGNTSLDLYG
jgi:hypothetical protein